MNYPITDSQLIHAVLHGTVEKGCVDFDVTVSTASGTPGITTLYTVQAATQRTARRIAIEFAVRMDDQFPIDRRLMVTNCVRSER